MAKRKAGRRRKASAGQPRRKASARPAGKGAVRKAARGRKASARPARRKTAAKRPRPRAGTAGASRKASGGSGKITRKTARKAVARKASTRKASSRTAPARTAVARKTPALNRERRIIRDDDIVPTPPSSLNLDRSASAARSGRRELSEKFQNHTETSPAITGGDIDADWESAYTVGDEAPGGDNPTPDQDIVDDIGKALGVQYEDNEELKGEKKISDRDKKRWELDPASAEDYNEHDED
jgi:hypothetical protein